MNVKEAIERGLYPKDEKGRALVPHGEGDAVTIYATDGPQHAPIVGLWHTGVLTWPANTCRLLPPPPRKVKFTGSVKYKGGDFIVWDFATDPPCIPEEGQSFPFTGEYEEPWE